MGGELVVIGNWCGDEKSVQALDERGVMDEVGLKDERGAMGERGVNDEGGVK